LDAHVGNATKIFIYVLFLVIEVCQNGGTNQWELYHDDGLVSLLRAHIRIYYNKGRWRPESQSRSTSHDDVVLCTRSCVQRATASPADTLWSFPQPQNSTWQKTYLIRSGRTATLCTCVVFRSPTVFWWWRAV